MNIKLRKMIVSSFSIFQEGKEIPPSAATPKNKSFVFPMPIDEVLVHTVPYLKALVVDDYYGARAWHLT